jgi:DNA repair protein RecN (Recombination protein N)
MLKSLLIENYALIEKLDISFDDGLSIITGETGAGKSILLGALGLILGHRADTSVLLDKQKKCIIEGAFLIKNLRLEGLFQENDLDYDDHAVFRREINPQGKSRAFINDTPVNLNTMKVIAEKLIDIHSQHQNLLVGQSSFRYNVLDSFAGITDQLHNYKQQYSLLTVTHQQLNDLLQQEQQSRANLDYYQFQYDELFKAALQPDEFKEIEEELDILNHAAEIKSSLGKAGFIIQDAPDNVVSKMAELTHIFKNLEKFSSFYEGIHQRLSSTEIELKDIARDIDRQILEVSDDPRRASELQLRFDLLQKLMLKHNVSDIDQLIEIRDDFRQKIDSCENLELEIEEYRTRIKKEEEALTKIASEISLQRKKAIPSIQDQINGLLHELGMPNAQFIVQQNTSNQLHSNGLDNIHFLFTANLGGEPQEISKVASGGELSRLMLSIKSVISRKSLLPTIIFDEIDTGVSGEIGFKMGSILEKIAKNMQVVSITHLPQVAAKGDKHFVVFKATENGNTKTMVKKLETEERIDEIAKMLGGHNPSQAVIQAALELLNQNIHKLN